MIDDPRERVFRVDTECYIVYLGKERDDYRPFLRIGNSPKLPERVKNFISTVVVTDSYTGNQLIEHENLQLPLNGETRYVGDPEGVNRLKQFLEEKDLPVTGYVYEDQGEDPGQGGAYVYFYRSGNLHVVRDGAELFDLRDRERDDSHFVSRADRAVRLVKANPLRFVPQDFSDPGFVLAGDRIYLFSEGRFGSASVSADYILHLASYGIDPDLLVWMMEDGPSEGLVERMKRAALSGKAVKVLSPAEAKVRSAVSVFAESKLSCDIVPCGREEVLVSGFSVRREGASFVCSFPKPAEGMEMRFEDGKRHPDVANSFFEGLGLPIRGIRPIEGVPYRFLAEASTDPDRLVREYLSEPLDSMRDVLDLRNRGALRDLSALAKAVTATSVSPATIQLLEARGRTFGAPELQELYPVYWNARELSRLCAAADDVDSGVKRQAGRFAALCPSLVPPARNADQLPLVGDIFPYRNSRYLFYRYNGLVTSLKLRQAKKSAEGIEKLLAPRDEEFFEKERKRLLDFIDGLAEVAPTNRKMIPVEERHPLRPHPEETPRPERQAEAPTVAAKPPEAPKPAGAIPSAARPGPVKPSFAIRPPAPDIPVPDLVPRRPARGRGLPSWVNAKTLVPVAVLAGVGGASVFLVRSCEKPRTETAAAAGTVPAVPVDPSVRTAPIPETKGGAASADGTHAVSAHKAAEKPEAPKPETANEVRKTGEAGVPRESPPSSSGKRPEPGAERKPSVAADARKTADRTAEPRTEGAREGGGGKGRSLPIIDTVKISITIRDVYDLVNETAEKNSYRRLDSPKDGRPDPNLIFPGAVFVLPDGTSYTVVKGDTLWDITVRFIRKSMREQEDAYKKLMISDRPKDEVIAELRKLRDSSRSTNLKARFAEALKQIEEE